MKFLDRAGVVTLVQKLKNRFQVKLTSGTNIKTINSESILGSGDILLPTTTVKSVTATYSFTAKSAGSSGYFSVAWATSSRPISVIVHTTSISALNGTQFSVVNATTSGGYITYYCPKATTSTISLTIYVYCYN